MFAHRSFADANFRRDLFVRQTRPRQEARDFSLPTSEVRLRLIFVMLRHVPLHSQREYWDDGSSAFARYHNTLSAFVKPCHTTRDVPG